MKKVAWISKVDKDSKVEKEKLKYKFKEKTGKELSRQELDELIIILAEMNGLIKKSV